MCIHKKCSAGACDLSNRRQERLGAKKARAFRRNLTLLVISILIIAFITGVYLFVGNRAAAGPTYTDVSAGPAYLNSSSSFSVHWSDSAGLSGYIFGSNLSGIFTKDSWTPFAAGSNVTSAYSSVSRTMGTRYGDIIEWRFWANDSKNDWNSIDPQRLFVDAKKVLLRTSMGDITIELYGDMPITTANFKNLTKMGIYDGTIFHRVINNTTPYMIQGGDPTGTGYGDPRITSIPDEFSSNPSHTRNDRGTIAMANAGPNTGSSQFFINIGDNNYLDGKHPVFGVVEAGMDVVDAIASVPRDVNNRPLTNVTLIKADFVS
jgi:peptidylprolyl isomerase